jgi:hypothetical protein
MNPQTLLSPATLQDLSAEGLQARLGQLLCQERHLLVDFLVHLAEFDRRKLYLDLGYSSLFVYCTEQLHLAKASAFRRTTAARLLRQFPPIAEHLRSGRLCLRTVCLLKDVLTADKHVELLERASGRTEEEVQVLVATLRPQPALADSIRKLPAPRLSAAMAPPELGCEAEGPPAVDTGSRREPAPTPPPQASPRKPDQLKPLSAELHVVRLTVGSEFIQQLEQVKQALSHKVPDGRLEPVLQECFRITLETCAHRRRGSDPPRGAGAQLPRLQANSAKARTPSSRYIPAAVRREVWQRDGGCCSFVGANGKRCGSRHRLEFHHIVPFATGGPSTVDNVSIRCKVHNLHQARKDFGQAHIDRCCGSKPAQATLW